MTDKELVATIERALHCHETGKCCGVGAEKAARKALQEFVTRFNAAGCDLAMLQMEIAELRDGDSTQ